MNNLKLAAPLAISLLLVATSAFAAPVTWTIPATTVGSATISGTFVYDASLPETERLVSINITESGPYQSNYTFKGTSGLNFVKGQQTSSISLHDRVIVIDFTGMPSTSGGTNIVSIIIGGCAFVYEGKCNSVYVEYTDDDVIISSAYPPTIPTMSEWSMIIFGALLAGGAGLAILRRRTVKQVYSA